MAVRILQLSDVHLTSTGRLVDGLDSRERLQIVLNAHQQQRVSIDLVLVTGDLTDDGTTEACQSLSASLDHLGVPVLAVPGNHDRPEAVRQIFPDDSIEIGPWRIIGIDTSRPDQIHGTIDIAAAMTRIDQFDRRPTVLAMHHPPLSLSTHRWFQLEGAADLLSALKSRPHVRAVLTGHLHAPFERSASADLRVLGCPSTQIAFTHNGGDVTVGESPLTGARLISLGDDGSLTSDLITV